MSKTDIKFLEDRLGMTETEGWLDLVADLKNLEESIVNLNNINSEQDLWVIKGQLRIINYIVNLENATHLALEELQDGNPT
ncbi:MAG TPA: hypothetical protein VLB82_02655 [Thermodesulfobacteriota bacterium]|mgnify:CR=1 FL=1|jgi:hypothetical protein|nr:hypothetical protein [Thermodesulfobacteriota bacterium]